MSDRGLGALGKAKTSPTGRCGRPLLPCMRGASPATASAAVVASPTIVRSGPELDVMNVLRVLVLGVSI